MGPEWYNQIRGSRIVVKVYIRVCLDKVRTTIDFYKLEAKMENMRQIYETDVKHEIDLETWLAR